MGIERLDSFQLLNVFVHVAGVRRYENGADAGQHVSSDQACFTQQTDVSRMMPGRDEHGPFLGAQGEAFPVFQDSLTRHRP